jgi:hypothetical protein
MLEEEAQRLNIFGLCILSELELSDSFVESELAPFLNSETEEMICACVFQFFSPELVYFFQLEVITAGVVVLV